MNREPCPDCGSDRGCITSGGRPAKKPHAYRNGLPPGRTPLMNPLQQAIAARRAGHPLTEDQTELLATPTGVALLAAEAAADPDERKAILDNELLRLMGKLLGE